MRISPTQQQSFKGYDACKIKALYMQNASSDTQRLIFDELSQVGKQEGFDVFIHGNEHLVSNLDDLHKKLKKSKWNFWSQDNKFFIEKDGKPAILYPKLFWKNQAQEAIELAKQLEIPAIESELILEGGNFFIGKKDNDKNYVILGRDILIYSALAQYLKNNGLPDLTYKELMEFILSGHIYVKSETCMNKLTLGGFYQQEQFWCEKVRELISKDFNVEKEDICLLPQPNYHIDLAIRPLDYPYVLVNDINLAERNLDWVEKISQDKNFTKPFRKELNKLKKKYAPSEKITETLEQKGFIPIPIGGGYGSYKINFLNAIINKKDDDLIYITGSADCDNKKYKILQDLFLADLIRKYPKIKRCYFIDGAQYKKEENIVMAYLRRFKGGIHCLCAELPLFNEKEN